VVLNRMKGDRSLRPARNCRQEDAATASVEALFDTWV
jgi:hypothetical protein